MKQARQQDWRSTSAKNKASGREDIWQHVVVDSSEAENITEFVYLGSLLTSDGDCNIEIKRRIVRATGVMAEFRSIWNIKQEH